MGCNAKKQLLPCDASRGEKLRRPPRHRHPVMYAATTRALFSRRSEASNWLHLLPYRGQQKNYSPIGVLCLDRVSGERLAQVDGSGRGRQLQFVAHISEARVSNRAACGRPRQRSAVRQPGFFPPLLLLVPAEKEDACCAGFGFSFFGLRFSRLLRCSLLAIGQSSAATYAK